MFISKNECLSLPKEGKVSSSYLFKYLLKELNIDKEKKFCSAILENMQVYSV